MYLTRYNPAQLDKLLRNTIGVQDVFDRFDRLFDENFEVLTKQNYPPHNIIKLKDNHYAIQMAAAGFSKEDIEITTEDGWLYIKGERNQENDLDYLYQGIANRTFTKSFTLSDDMRVVGAEMKDGMLFIALEQVIPEEKKKKVVEIGSIKNESFISNLKSKLLGEADDMKTKEAA